MKNAKITSVIKSLNRRRKGPRSPRRKLNLSWDKIRKEFEPEELILIAARTDYLPLKKKAVAEFLKRRDLSFSDFYYMLEKTKDVLEKYKNLRDNFWKKFLALCTVDHLVELTEAGETEASTKLFNGIEDGSIRRNKGKQALIRLFKKMANDEIRMDLWKRIKKIDPSKKDLIYILDLECMYFPSTHILCQIKSEAEKLLRQKHKIRENKKVENLLRLAKQIKPKKGQE